MHEWPGRHVPSDAREGGCRVGGLWHEGAKLLVQVGKHSLRRGLGAHVTAPVNCHGASHPSQHPMGPGPALTPQMPRACQACTPTPLCACGWARGLGPVVPRTGRGLALHVVPLRGSTSFGLHEGLSLALEAFHPHACGPLASPSQTLTFSGRTLLPEPDPTACCSHRVHQL